MLYSCNISASWQGRTYWYYGICHLVIYAGGAASFRICHKDLVWRERSVPRRTSFSFRFCTNPSINIRNHVNFLILRHNNHCNENSKWIYVTAVLLKYDAIEFRATGILCALWLVAQMWAKISCAVVVDLLERAYISLWHILDWIQISTSWRCSV